MAFIKLVISTHVNDRDIEQFLGPGYSSSFGVDVAGKDHEISTIARVSWYQARRSVDL
ncbi:Unknown protein sequence [Pseudomonas amygdali pv. lachrymans]|nr:Unknown protein sequence [Pseudomonas amygdali pv. lachrymans]